MKKLTKKHFIKFLINLANKINLHFLKYFYIAPLLAEAVGFEPTYDGVRAHCLTAWRCFHIEKTAQNQCFLKCKMILKKVKHKISINFKKR